MSNKKAYKDLLVQYRGGGYDGCHWEWNYFLFDAKGKFHNLASTGRRGIKTQEEAISILADDKNPPFTYRLTVKKDLQEFQSKCAESHVLGVSKKVNEIYKSDVMYFECDECSNKIYPQNDDCETSMYHTGYHGDGGIGVVMEGKLCSDCYSINACGFCGFCGEYDENPEFNDDGKCRYCRELESNKQSIAR